MSHLRSTPPRLLALRSVLISALVVTASFGGPALAQETPAPSDDPAPDAQAESTENVSNASTALIAPSTDESLEFEDRDGISTADIRIGTEGSANARWLSDLYERALLREADVEGLDHWLAYIPAGGAEQRELLTEIFLTSREGASGEVVRAYGDILDRETDNAGLAYWTDYLRDRPVTELRFLLYVSDEFYNNSGGTSTDFVTQLYARILEREADPEGLAYWVEQLDLGVTRMDVTFGFHFSDESMANRVEAYYDEIFGRAPTDAERADGVAALWAADERDFRGHLMASDEAFETYVDAVLGS